MATVSWGNKGVLLIDYLLCGTTIMAVCYNCAVLQKLERAIQNKRRGKFTKTVNFVIHDIACPHAAHVTQDWLQQSLWDVFDLPSYSPSGFHLFSQTYRQTLADSA